MHDLSSLREGTAVHRSTLECWFLFCLREFVLAYSAERALEVCWKVFKSGAWLDACLWHTYFRVVNPSAYVANIFLHSVSIFVG